MNVGITERLSDGTDTGAPFSVCQKKKGMFSVYVPQYGIASSLPGQKESPGTAVQRYGPFLFSGRRHSRGDRAYIVFDSRTIPALAPSASALPMPVRVDQKRKIAGTPSPLASRLATRAARAVRHWVTHCVSYYRLFLLAP
jgi:hypothetical protein